MQKPGVFSSSLHGNSREGDNGINYAAAGVGPNFSSPTQPVLASCSRRDNSAATTAAGRPDYPPGERTHRAVPAPAGPSCSSSPECCLFIPLTAPSFLHYKLPAAPLGMHHGVRSQPQYRRSGRFIYYRVCLHSYLRPCLAGPSITHTSACCPSHPPKPQRWQYLCLSPSLSFSLTQPSVCPLYSTS
ncbi:unnamed protein product [Leuciscus chuanchicus]